MPVYIDPIEILPNTVSETEFGYLNGASSNIQTQIDARLVAPAAPIAGTFIRYNGAAWVGVTNINLVGDLQINSANHYIGLAAQDDLIALASGQVTINGTIEVTDGIIIGAGIEHATLNIGNLYSTQLTFETDGTRASFGLKVAADSLLFCSWDGGANNLEFLRGASTNISCFANANDDTSYFRVYGEHTAVSRYIELTTNRPAGTLYTYINSNADIYIVPAATLNVTGALTVTGVSRSNANFNCNGSAGISATFTDLDGGTITFVGGIATAKADPPPP